MAALTSRDIAYFHQTTKLDGYFCAPVVATDQPVPGIVVVHGAHGLNGHVIACARKIAEEGYAVLAADLWGERRQLSTPSEISSVLAEFGSDRDLWMGRLIASCETLADQREVATGVPGMVGYCFGGTSVLEFVRQGGELTAAVSFHGALDLIGKDWSRATSKSQVLIATGQEDPLAKPEDLALIEDGLSSAGITWDTMRFGGVKHAFTEPDGPRRPPFAAYDARADRRSFAAMAQVFKDVFNQ